MEGYPIRKGCPFYVSLKILNTFFIYPSLHNRNDLRKFIMKSVIIKVITGYLTIVGAALHWWMVVKETVAIDPSENISTIAGGIGAMMSCVLTSLLHKQWSSFLIDLIDCTKFGRPSSFETISKRGNLLSVLYMTYCSIGTLLYAVVAFMDASVCIKVAEEIGNHVLCRTITPTWFPFDINATAVLVLQVWAVFCIIPPSATIYFLYSEAAEFIVSHIDQIKMMIEDVFKDDDVGRRIEKLGTCIRYHQHILRLSKELNDLMKRNIGHMTLIWAVSFGCIGNEILNSKALGGCIFLCGYVAALFWVSHAGQRLFDQSLSLADAVYDSEWHLGTVKEQKNVLYVLAKCQIPLTLHAFPFGIYQYSLFVLMLKTGYSYLTLLQKST